MDYQVTKMKQQAEIARTFSLDSEAVGLTLEKATELAKRI